MQNKSKRKIRNSWRVVKMKISNINHVSTNINHQSTRNMNEIYKNSATYKLSMQMEQKIALKKDLIQISNSAQVRIKNNILNKSRSHEENKKYKLEELNSKKKLLQSTGEDVKNVLNILNEDKNSVYSNETKKNIDFIVDKLQIIDSWSRDEIKQEDKNQVDLKSIKKPLYQEIKSLDYESEAKELVRVLNNTSDQVLSKMTAINEEIRKIERDLEKIISENQKNDSAEMKREESTKIEEERNDGLKKSKDLKNKENVKKSEKA